MVKECQDSFDSANFCMFLFDATAAGRAAEGQRLTNQ
jgi:hypothetical protein